MFISNTFPDLFYLINHNVYMYLHVLTANCSKLDLLTSRANRFNLIALRKAKTLYCFGLFECNRVTAESSKNEYKLNLQRARYMSCHI